MANTLSPEKIDLFEHMKISKAIPRLAIPTVLGTMVMILYNLADTFFVGLLNSPVQTSAVTLVAPVILLFNAVNNLFGVGAGSLISRSLGSKDFDTARKTSCVAFYASVISGALFSLLAIVLQNPLLHLLGSTAEDHAATWGYMMWTVFCGAIPSILNVVMSNAVRAEGNVVHATVGTAGGCLLNIILDPIFILPWGLNMGAAGAGLATFLSNTAATLYYIVYMAVKKDTFVNMKLRWLRPNREIMSGIASVGLPASLQNILNVTGMTLLNNLMAAYGLEAVSAIGIAHKLALIPMYFSMGIGQGVMPLVGYNYAARNMKRIREAIAFTLKISAVLVLLIVAAFVIFPTQIIRVFMSEPKVVEYGAAFLRGQSLSIPFFALDFLAVGVFQACGMGRYSLYFALARKVVLEIPAMLLLNRLFPMYGLAYAMFCAELILGVAAVFMLRKITADGPRDGLVEKL